MTGGDLGAKFTLTPFSFPVRVYWEDTDGGGVVYHARYLHFLERERTEWLRAQGVEQRDLRERDDLVGQPIL